MVRVEFGDPPRSREPSYSMRTFAHARGYGKSMSDWITMRTFHESDGVEDWRVVGEGACAYFRTGSFAAGARLVNAISELTGVDDHQPDVDLRYDGVIVRLITVAPDYYGLSERDLELARRISAIARKLGVPAEPANVETVLVTIDAFDVPKVKPFWRAVLGYQDRADSPRTSSTPAVAARQSGSRKSTRQTRRSTGSISTSGCRPTRPRRGSRPRSPRAATSSPTSMRPPGGRWATPRATSPTWPRRRAAIDQSLPRNCQPRSVSTKPSARGPSPNRSPDDSSSEGVQNQLWTLGAEPYERNRKVLLTGSETRVRSSRDFSA